MNNYALIFIISALIIIIMGLERNNQRHAPMVQRGGKDIISYSLPKGVESCGRAKTEYIHSLNDEMEYKKKKHDEKEGIPYQGPDPGPPKESDDGTTEVLFKDTVAQLADKDKRRKKGTPSKGSPKGRKGSPKGRKGSPKGRKGSPKGRKGSPKGRKGSPKGRKGSPKGRKGSPKGSPKGARKGARKGQTGACPPGIQPGLINRILGNMNTLKQKLDQANQRLSDLTRQVNTPKGGMVQRPPSAGYMSPQIPSPIAPPPQGASYPPMPYQPAPYPAVVPPVAAPVPTVVNPPPRTGTVAPSRTLESRVAPRQTL